MLNDPTMEERIEIKRRLEEREVKLEEKIDKARDKVLDLESELRWLRRELEMVKETIQPSPPLEMQGQRAKAK